MKTNALRLLAVAATICAVVALNANAAPPPGGGMMGGGPVMGGLPKMGKMSGAMAKVFGKTTAFSAETETELSGESPMTIPGKLAFSKGKSRSEINLAEAKGGEMGGEMAGHLKSMGMDKMVIVGLPEKKTSYVIYPSMQAYIESPLEETPGATNEDHYTVKVTELGKDTVDGKAVTKNKVVVSEGEKPAFEATVWNSTDKTQFPVKIEHDSEGVRAVTLYKNVTFDAPEDSLFQVPKTYKKYSSMMELMQAMVMKQMGGAGMQLPPGHPPTK